MLKPATLFIKFITICFFYFFIGCSGFSTQSDDINNQSKTFEKITPEELINKSLTSFDGKTYSETSVVYKAELIENKLSEVYHGFAGIWLAQDNSNNISIAVQKSESFESNRENILEEFSKIIFENISEDRLLGNSDISGTFTFQVTNGDHSFRELQNVRDILTPVIHKRNDIIESFIDSKSNSFKIGVKANTNIEEYYRIFDNYGIDRNLVTFFETEPVKLNIAKESFSNQSTLTLRDYLRPFRGGLQIEGYNPINQRIGVCTLGFNVKLDGVNMWITNSHCTSEFATTSITHFGQSIWNSLSSSTYIGSEYRDSAGSFFTRYSDAALIEKSTQSSKFGYIYITDDYESGWNEGSVTLIPVGSNYKDVEIVSESPNTISHLGLHKIGRTGGWNTGTISNSCTTVSNIAGHNYTLYCQIRSTIYSGSGDSGAPVFQVVSIGTPGNPTTLETISLVGINWGSNHGEQRSYHSRIDGIRQDLVESHETLVTH